MINVKVNYDRGQISSFIVKGHANFDTYGRDIVCSAVTATVFTSVNLMLRYDKTSVTVHNEEKNAVLACQIVKTSPFLLMIIDNMLEQLSEIAQHYPKNIKIEN